MSQMVLVPSRSTFGVAASGEALLNRKENQHRFLSTRFSSGAWVLTRVCRLHVRGMILSVSARGVGCGRSLVRETGGRRGAWARRRGRRGTDEAPPPLCATPALSLITDEGSLPRRRADVLLRSPEMPTSWF